MDQRAALGWALHDRADDVAGRVLHGLEGSPSYEVLASIAEADRLATQVVGRWLATGDGATEEEHAKLSGPGSLVGIYPLPELVKAYLAWREAAMAVLAEQAEALGCDAALVAEARVVIERSCDAALVRMGRQFDDSRSRLEDELAAERAKLAHQALHDPLTGLPNRVLLYDRLEQALRASGRYGGAVALLFVDLDGFKTVNDRCGHETGDQLLVAVARRLRRAVRPSDTPARIGGDEFVVLCDRLPDAVEARRLADRILETLRDPFLIARQRLALSASVGIALGTAGEAPDAVVGRADAAMYAAKRRGDACELAPAG